LTASLQNEDIETLLQLDNIVYLESPVFWKIKEVLKGWVAKQNDPRMRQVSERQQQSLKKIPQYILDVFELLNVDFVQYERDPKLVEIQQHIQRCIAGNLEMSDSGDLMFSSQNDSGQHFSVDLHKTASGTTALGIVALLLDKLVIVPNSVLIFDEPEVNLHPAWQHVMIQVLYHLSLAGVNVVMATHSFDMIKSIEKMMEEHENQSKDVESHFSLIQLQDGNTINEDESAFRKVDAIKADLGTPLFDLFSGGETEGD
jgi:predicted ATPase